MITSLADSGWKMDIEESVLFPSYPVWTKGKYTITLLKRGWVTLCYGKTELLDTECWTRTGALRLVLNLMESYKERHEDMLAKDKGRARRIRERFEAEMQKVIDEDIPLYY